jgi:hypothetical protein
MTPKTANRLRTRNVWAGTVVVVSRATERAAKHVTPSAHPAPIEQPAPATKTPAEKEADRWVAQMMFENYNP